MILIALFLATATALALRWYANRLGQKCFLSPRGNIAAKMAFFFEGVEVVAEDSAGIDRASEPVTSGVPLPEGMARDASRFRLMDANGQNVPCQFTPTCRWPDGSIKWALLDFQADVRANANSVYVLRRGKSSVSPDCPVVFRETGSAISMSNGRLQVDFNRQAPSLIESVRIDGDVIVSPDKPITVELANSNAVVYSCSKPDSVSIEENGPMRGTVLLKGRFVARDGGVIHDGKVGYDL